MSDWDEMDFGKRDMVEAYLYLAMLVVLVGVPVLAIVLLVRALVG